MNNKIKKEKIAQWALIVAVLVVAIGTQFVYQYFKNGRRVDFYRLVGKASKTFDGHQGDFLNAKDLQGESKKFLFEEMTGEERNEYDLLLQKMMRNEVTKQDFEVLGKLMNRVTSRLPQDRQKVVKEFLAKGNALVGDDVKEVLFNEPAKSSEDAASVRQKATEILFREMTPEEGERFNQLKRKNGSNSTSADAEEMGDLLAAVLGRMSDSDRAVVERIPAIKILVGSKTKGNAKKAI